MPSLHDQRVVPISKVPASGWSVTGLPIPRPPLSDLDETAMKYWVEAFRSPVSLCWGPGELVSLERLATLHSAFIERPDPRNSTEQRNIAALLGLTLKSRRDLKLQVVSDDEFFAWLADPSVKKSFMVMSLEVLAALQISPDDDEGETPPDTDAEREDRFSQMSFGDR